MNTFERVRSIVAEGLDVSEEQITPQTSLTDDLAADSLDIVQISMALEEAFCVEFGDDTEDLTTVERIVEYIQGKLGAQP